MAKRDRSAELFSQLRTLSQRADAPEAEGILRTALASTSSVFVERAAPLVAEGGWRSLVPDLEAAFERFRLDTGKDQYCVAKIQIVRALSRLGAGVDVLLTAIDHFQAEFTALPDEVIDGGIELRAAAIILLADAEYPLAAEEAVRKLADREGAVRAAAVRALVVDPKDGIYLLFRHLVWRGDDPRVLIECFRALILLDPRGVEFVIDYLQSEQLADAVTAAIALSESGRPEALAPVIALWKQRRSEDEDASLTLILAIVTFRLDEGIDFLVDVVRDGDSLYGMQALNSMEMYRDDERVGAWLREAAADSGNAELIETVARRFRG